MASPGRPKQPCKCCGHNDLEGIEKLLLSGVPHRDIITLYPGLTARDLQKHVNDHMTLTPLEVKRGAIELSETVLVPEVIPSDPKAMAEYMAMHLYRSSQRLAELAEMTRSIKAEEALAKVADSYLRYAAYLEHIQPEEETELTVRIELALPEGLDE